METNQSSKTIEILLVEDNPADVLLAEEELLESKVINNLNVVMDGEEALDYLYKRNKYPDAVTPDLILLDLNLPKVDGREVLINIKSDEALKKIPVVILTSSEAEEDIAKAYENYANCYITKPVDIAQFSRIVNSIDNFWFSIVRLPK